MNSKIIVLFGLVLLVCTTLESADAPGNQQKDIVKMQNRRFSPTPGIDPELRKAVKTNNCTRGIVQFKNVPSPSDGASLRKAGVELGSFMGDTVYLAEFYKGADLDSLTNSVRWAGLLLTEDKVKKSLWQRRLKRGKEKVLVIAEFYPRTLSNEIYQVFAKYDSPPQPYGLKDRWAIQLRFEQLESLAAEPIVHWLAPGTPGFRPLR